jgi:hypothetical protein
VCDDSWGLRQHDLVMVTGAGSYVAYWRPAGVTPNRCLEFPRKNPTTVPSTSSEPALNSVKGQA